MRRVLTPLAIGSLLWLAASTAQALGFGRVSNTTLLGQPLNFAAIVRLDADESLARECVFAEVQSGDNPLAAGQIRVTLDAGADPNERSVRVTTSSLIDEPVVTVTVILGCTSKTSRKFVAFIDPPVINLAQSAAPEPAEIAPQRVESQVAPVVAVVQATSPTAPVSTPAPARAAKPVPRPRPRPPAAVVAGSKATAAAAITPAAPRSKAPNAAMAKAAPVPAAAPGTARLKLETTAPVAGARASEPAATAVVAAPAPASAASEATQPSEMNLLLAKERERLQALEDSLNRLRSETQTNQKALATVQGRLKEAETARYANPLVYALAGLSGLLLLAVAALWWGRARSKREAQWWTPPAPTTSAVASAASPAPSAAVAQVIKAAPVLPVVKEDAHSPLLAPVTLNSIIDEPGLTGGAQDTLPAPVTLQAWPDTRSVEDEARRELSVEELIDLEQQAEFFVVLGQDEAAIDLLMGHVRNTGGISPLPYLKLLEIYRRRGDYAAYERIRERFNRRFNAYAPDWDSDLQHGRALDEYPEIFERIQSQWAEPLRVMKMVDSSLFRRQESSHTFDLPAYRELLFLYSIARDLVERSDGADAVDLLLPIDLDPPGIQIAHHLSATQAYVGPSADQATLTLDLDFSEPAAGEAGNAAAESERDFAPGSDFLGLPDNPPKPRGPGRR